MNTTVSYTEARARLAELMDQVANDCEPITITRRGHPDVVLMSARELAGLLETIHILKSPVNATRLFDALDRAERGEGVRMTVEELRREVGLTGRRNRGA